MTQDKSRTEFGYYRTACECEPCRKVCTTEPGFLIPEDLARIATQIGMAMDSDEFMEWANDSLLASPGVTLKRTKYDDLQIPMLVPARGQDSNCMWLGTDKKCEIHKVAPFACAFLDSHISDVEYANRRTYGLGRLMRALAANEPYYFIWNALWFEEDPDNPGTFPRRAPAAMDGRV